MYNFVNYIFVHTNLFVLPICLQIRTCDTFCSIPICTLKQPPKKIVSPGMWEYVKSVLKTRDTDLTYAGIC
jgi:hypothetical protein